MTAKIVLDSISPAGVRLTTMEVEFHRFVLAEFNTHRVLSRNSASSRAIPVERQLATLKEQFARPVAWPAEQPGMQGGTELEDSALYDAEDLWDELGTRIIQSVDAYVAEHEKSERVHKSVLNRLLEPFMMHKVIVTSAEWENFFSQRCSPLAQPEIRVAAEAMRDAMNASTPTEVARGNWHTPYVQDDEQELHPEVKKMISAARCARVSYLTHDGQQDIGKDIWLYQKLVTADPPHWSPLEHVATPSLNGRGDELGNFHGWRQLRHSLT
jgi:thymidylate synthase ThyX